MRVLLWVILICAFFIRIYHINYNTAFLDEAQYIVIGLRILNGDIEAGLDDISWVGGSPFFYPVLTGIFYNMGGIVGSRILSVILGTISVFLMYQFTKQLLFFRSKKTNERAGLIAAAFMAVTTIAVHSSRFAIYDSLAFPLFLGGVVLLHKAIYSGERRFYLGAAGVLFLSFLAKYITIIFFPVLLFIPLFLAYKTKHKESIRGVFLHFCLPLLLLTGLYAVSNFANLQEFIVDQGVVQNENEGQVTRLFWEYTGFSYALFFLSMPFLWRNDKFLIVVLLFCSLIPFFVHSVTGNTDSVQQHTMLSIIFLLPVIGAGFALLVRKRKWAGIGLTLLALITQILISEPQVKSAESFWPNLKPATAVIRQDLKPNDRVLAESDDSMYLELKDTLIQEQVNGPFYFEYDGKEGIDAYTAAIGAKYFKYIQLEGTYFSDDEKEKLAKAIDDHYKKILDKDGLTVYKVSE